MAEKTDLGRLTSPSIIKLADESLRLNSGSQVNGRSSAEIWVDIDKILEVLYFERKLQGPKLQSVWSVEASNYVHVRLMSGDSECSFSWPHLG